MTKDKRGPVRLKSSDYARFEAAIENWRKYGTRSKKEGDAEMAKLHERDVRDLQGILQLIRSGNYTRAQGRIDNLDTLVRDQIPVSIYKVVYRDRE